MYSFIKPKKLCKGDTIATISLSCGSAGEQDMHWRYLLAKNRLEEEFGLRVIETPNSQKGRNFIYHNPQARAEDLMWALKNPEVKAIFLNQGGDDGIRILPYIDFDVIKNNPKIFMGLSDGSTFCNMFTRAGVVSYYGPNVLTTLTEPGKIHDYTAKWMKKILFNNEPVGPIEPAQEWTAEERQWALKEDKIREMTTKQCGYELINGKGKVVGTILGGCSAPLQQAKGTLGFPDVEAFSDSIIFLEGIGGDLSAVHLMRSLAATGMFTKAVGVVFAKTPIDNEKSKSVILKVLVEEEGLIDLPIICNIDCGHTAPMTIMPLGVKGEIDCEKSTFSIIESAVI